MTEANSVTTIEGAGAVAATGSRDTELTTYSVGDEALKRLIKQGEKIDPYEDYDAAKQFIKGCTTLRSTIEAERKEKKAGILRDGRLIDGEAKRIREVIEGVENPIKDKKAEIDNESAYIEAERIEALTRRLDDLVVTPAHVYGKDVFQLEERLEEIKAVVVDDSFEEFFHTADEHKANSIAVLEGAITREKAESARRAELEKEEERQAEERARLAEQRAAQDAEDAERRAAIEREEAELAERRRAIKEEEDRIAAEKRAAQLKADAEAEAEAEAARIEALAPDRAKLEKLAKDIHALKVPKVKSNEANLIVTGVMALLGRAERYIDKSLGESF